MTKDCSICKGSKYCISKPNKNDYKFPEEENQYLIDLECGIWNCHTAVIKLLKKNEELEKQIEKMRCCGNCKNNFSCHYESIDELARKDCGKDFKSWEPV